MEDLHTWQLYCGKSPAPYHVSYALTYAVSSYPKKKWNEEEETKRNDVSDHKQ